MANKIGCSAGKTSLVDPNAFDGQNSSSNISVPLEDLNISVELSTEKKGRTILTTNKLGNKLTGLNVGSETSSMKLNFIEGTKDGSTGNIKSLTTKFTDLTTTFDEGGDGENLGITSIDIDFNTSYAPLITINLIDVRGSAIFQNDKAIKDATNKYATFFTLPYPMYNLTIKGYYGQPVTYCLHMTKFNSKFNSHTGNFEITCSFIGYTYAMLSDLLLGYLKAIPYTNLGRDRYAELKKEDPTLLTLVELLRKIAEINNDVKRISAEDPDAKQFGSAEEKMNQLSNVESIMSNIGVEISIPSRNSEYKYIVIDPATSVNNKNSTKIEDYNKKVGEAIDTYNGDGNKYTIDNKDLFTSVWTKSYQGLSISMLNPIFPPLPLPITPDVQALYDEKTKSEDKLKQILPNKTKEEFDRKRSEIYNYVKSNFTFSDDFVFDVYDMNNLYSIITAKKIEIDKQKKLLQKSLAESLKAAVTKTLGFSPTVRGIVNIFTAASEVFLHVLFKISESAKKDVSGLRRAQLEPKFKISVDSTDQFGAGPNGGKTPLNFFPWPDYRVNDENDALTETYLGEPFVLEIPSDVDELRFMDELLKAFLTAQAEIDEISQDLEQSQTNWYPINPLDTRLFNDKYPYDRMEALYPNDIYRLMTIRAMIFLGVTNAQDSSGKTILTTEEIEAVAKAEVGSMIADTTNASVLQAITANATIDSFLTSSGKVIALIGGGLEGSAAIEPVLKLNGDHYDYSYVWNTGNVRWYKILPISGPFEGTFPLGEDTAVEYARDSHLFLTNYTTTDLSVVDFYGNTTTKVNDGGIYISIIDVVDYDSSSNALPLPTTEVDSTNVLNLEKLKTSPTEAGYNILGGNYGIQEFRKLDFGGELSEQPYRMLFYEDGAYGDYSYNKSNGLAYKRKISGEDGKPTSTSYDNYLSIQTIKTLGDWDDAIRLIDYDHTEKLDFWLFNNYRTHKDYGKNRKLFTELVKGSSDITYPYVNFQVGFNTDDANFGKDLDLAPVSLFGSRLYYAQSGSDYENHAKALLFLHTFPWNGMIETDGDSDPTIFTTPEILNTFKYRGGFVSVPKLWPAFIGGLLWRYDNSEPIPDDTGKIIDGGSGVNDPILWENTTESFIPNFSHSSAWLGIVGGEYPHRDQYMTSIKDGDFPSAPMVFESRVLPGREYKKLEPVLLTLPDQAKIAFKKAFFDFVQSDDLTMPSDWDNIRAQFDVFNGTDTQWKIAYDTIINPSNLVNVTTNGTVYTEVNKNIMKGFFNVKSGDKHNLDNYVIFTPLLDESVYAYNFILENRDDTQAVKTLMDLFMGETIIANMTPNIWQGADVSNSFERQDISVKTEDLNIYFSKVVEELIAKRADSSIANKNKKLEQEVFGTDDENLIKFQLYKTCKNLYDKWIGGAEDDNIIFQCGARNSLDQKLANKYRGKDGSGDVPLRLIDSFRFVSRSFKDIGSDLLINPLPVSEYLLNNPNSSFYDAVTSLLSANNFDFIPLPNYINYNDPETLATIFDPMPSYTEQISSNTCGPTFVCVYLGETSKHLDVADSEYPSDGFDIQCDEKGNMLPGPPIDLISTSAKTHENNVAVFAVNYSQQNQNIFKDITLDQSEFTETAESLQIIDDISKKGSENHRTFGGQNMYNVYSVRSYKAEVEMMGNAMIQPMMYFQLNNIPMFHGAYMIIHVKHNIKPNSMSTHFTGVKIRGPLTPMIDSTDLFMSLLGSLETTNAKKSDKVALGNPTTNSTTPITSDESGVVAGGTVSNTNNKFAPITSCKAPSKQVSGLSYYTKENPGPSITSTKITFSDLVNYLNSTNLSAVEKRATYCVAVLEQGKKGGFNAFGNNLFGFNVEGSFAGLDSAIKEGKLVNTFCYGDAERGRVFPQFSMWSDSVNVFAQHTVRPRFIEASRADGYWKQVKPEFNFYNNGIKATDSVDVQALKFTVLYFMEWNSPAFKADVVNSITSATNPTYGDYKDPASGYKRSTKHVHDVYISAIGLFK